MNVCVLCASRKCGFQNLLKVVEKERIYLPFSNKKIDTYLHRDHPYITSAKLLSVWVDGFREEWSF